MENEGIYSQRLRAGRRRTYFFDVRTTKGEDYYITITESKKRFNEDGYDRHKIFLYKEDFNKFVTALSNTVNHVKDTLMPDYDFNEFDREPEEYIQGAKLGGENNSPSYNKPVETKPSFEESPVDSQPEPSQVGEQVNAELDDIIDEDLSF